MTFSFVRGTIQDRKKCIEVEGSLRDRMAMSPMFTDNELASNGALHSNTAPCQCTCTRPHELKPGKLLAQLRGEQNVIGVFFRLIAFYRAREVRKKFSSSKRWRTEDQIAWKSFKKPLCDICLRDGFYVRIKTLWKRFITSNWDDRREVVKLW